MEHTISCLKSKAMNSQRPSGWGQIHTDQWGVSSLSCGPSVLPCEGRSDLCHSAHTSSPRKEASDTWLYQGHHCLLPSEGLCLNSITKEDNTCVTGIRYYQPSAEHSQGVCKKGLHHGPLSFLQYHYGHLQQRSTVVSTSAKSKSSMYHTKTITEWRLASYFIHFIHIAVVLV